jgi:hypothetical protein
MLLEIVAHKLPGLTFGQYTNVHIAIQRGKENIEAVRGDAANARWSFECQTVEADGALDFRGPYIQGKRGERFVYLSWGTLDGAGALTMFGRIKLMLAAVPDATLAEALKPGKRLVGTLDLVDEKGRLRYASVRPPAIVWSAASS